MINTTLQTLKGFRDFIGNRSDKRQWLINKIVSVFQRYGFEALETPAVEYASLLLGKYGNEADKLVYTFKDKGERHVALRYDQTVPTARVIAQYHNDINFPYKRYQVQSVWRADKPQKGRYREFTQCDADIIGSSSSLADAEILALFIDIYSEIGFKTLKIKINDRKSLFSLVQSAGISKEKLPFAIQILDKIDKIGLDNIYKEFECNNIDKKIVNKIFDSIKSTTNPPQEIQQIITYISKINSSHNIIEYSPLLARGLDYYTGMIFEGIIPEYTVGSIGGGGRYDNLINDLVGYDKPAVGFGIGFDRTLEAADINNLIPIFTSNAQVLVTIFSEELLDKSIELLSLLRKNNIHSELTIDINKKLDQQLKYASKKNIPYVLILGPDEIKNKVIMLKDMKTGDQKTFNKEELIKFLISQI